MKNLYFAIVALIIIKIIESKQDFGDSNWKGITFPSINLFSKYSRFDKEVNNKNHASKTVYSNKYASSRLDETKPKDDFLWRFPYQLRTKKFDLINFNEQPKFYNYGSETPKQNAKALGFQNNLDSNWKLRAVSVIEKDAGSRSKGECGVYVSRAIQKAKGAKLEKTGIESAKDFGSFLNKMGYRATSKKHWQAKTGDIAIFDAAKGHRHGHIQILGSDGKWRSDFKQNNFNPWRDVSNPSYVIYE
jgi:hypothetical protein